MRKLFEYVFDQHYWIALGAFFQTIFSCLVFEFGWFDSVLLSCFNAAATFTIYNLHQWFSMHSFAVYHQFRPGKNENERRYQVIRMVLGIVVLFITYWRLSSFPVLASLLLVGLSGIAFLYSIPTFRNRRLRDVPYLKTILVALVWVGTTVLMPALLAGTDAGTWLPLAGQQVFFLLAITIPFDIRDMALEEALGVKTLIQVLGEKGSRIIALVLLILALVPGFYLPPWNRWACYITFLPAAILIWNSNPKRPHWYYTGLLDGLLVLQGAVAFEYTAMK